MISKSALIFDARPHFMRADLITSCQLL